VFAIAADVRSSSLQSNSTAMIAHHIGEDSGADDAEVEQILACERCRMTAAKIREEFR
jgi:hypothetical protein